MKIIKNNYKSFVSYPPVTVKCGNCGSIITIEPEDAYLNEHYVWEWYCPCCNSKRKSRSRWQMERVYDKDIKNTVIKDLDVLKETFPDTEIYIEIPGNVARCKIGDAMIYETPQGWIAIDAE